MDCLQAYNNFFNSLKGKSKACWYWEH
jgi:hypothetical protein